MEEEEESGGEGGSGGGIVKKIVLGIVGLIVLLIAAAAAFLFLNQEEEEEKVVLREGPPPLETPMYTDLGTFVINLKGGRYFLKANIQLAFVEPTPKLWLEARMPIVKDLIITQLQSLSPKQVADQRTRRLLRRDILMKLNSLFPNKPLWEDRKPIKRVLFQEFYRQ